MVSWRTICLKRFTVCVSCARCAAPSRLSPNTARFAGLKGVLTCRGWKEAFGATDTDLSPAILPLRPRVLLLFSMGEIDRQNIGDRSLDLSPLFLPNAHCCPHHRPGRGEEDSPPSGEDRTPSPRIGSLDAELTRGPPPQSFTLFGQRGRTALHFDGKPVIS